MLEDKKLSDWAGLGLLKSASLPVGMVVFGLAAVLFALAVVIDAFELGCITAEAFAVLAAGAGALEFEGGTGALVLPATEDILHQGN